MVQLNFIDKIVPETNMKIGYARVSSNNQDLELQKQELIKVGCKRIFSESVSAKDNNRAELMLMIESLRDDCRRLRLITMVLIHRRFS